MCDTDATSGRQDDAFAREIEIIRKSLERVERRACMKRQLEDWLVEKPMIHYIDSDQPWPDVVYIIKLSPSAKPGETPVPLEYRPMRICKMSVVKFVDAFEVFECSACNEHILMGRKPKYCPNCRAKVVD